MWPLGSSIGYADGVTGHDVTMVSFVVHSELSIGFQRPFSLRAMSGTTYGRGTGVVCGLGVGAHLPAHGVGVGVGVGVDVGVGVGVGVDVGVGVGAGPAV